MEANKCHFFHTWEDLLKTTSASLGNSLQGQLPGLTLLQQSGEPGYDFSIANLYLRGRTSYASGQKCWYMSTVSKPRLKVCPLRKSSL